MDGVRRFMLRVPACQTCGLCCAPGIWRNHNGDGRHFVNLEPEDIQGMTRAQRRTLVVLDEWGNPCMRMKGGMTDTRCRALAGDVGKSVACRIYQRRPATCRTFLPGGPGCLMVLKMARRPIMERPPWGAWAFTWWERLWGWL